MMTTTATADRQRNTLRLVALALLAAAGNAVAAEPEAPYYGALHFGRNNLSGVPASVSFGAITVPGSVQLDRGSHAGVMFGRRTENARFEVEYQSGRASVEGISLGAVTQAAGGKARYEVLTINAYRTAAFTADLTGFVGAGIGLGRFSLPQLGPIGACNCFPSASDRGFAYQLRLGAEYQVLKDQHVMAQYTSIRLPGAASSGGIPSVTYAKKRVGAFTVGYRIGF